MTTSRLPPLDFLRECFHYDPKTGRVSWRARPLHHFASEARGRGWNTQLAGTTGSVRENGVHNFRLCYDGRVYSLDAHTVAYAMHHGTTAFEELDHRNVDPSDNREVNIRPATRAQNNANREGWSKTGLPKGVHQRRGRFIASGTFRGKTYQIGAFTNPFEAHEAYCAWARPLHGEFFNPGPNKLGVFG